MPGRDKTGPMGMDQMTGRGAGSCAGRSETGRVQDWGLGCGRGMGRRGGFRGGMGRGPRAGWSGISVKQSPQEERSFLENEKEALENRLNAVKQRMGELDKNDTQKTKE